MTNWIVEAPPGAGKTTRVPAAFLSSVEGAVVVLEPRRIAARMAARWVARQMGETVGKTVGYQVRFEECGGPDTRLWYYTEGVLSRRMISNPTLRGIDVVVLDEFHERHIETDVALALLRRLQRTSRPDLKLVVMSATMAADPVKQFLGQTEVRRTEGRLHPLSIEYTPHSPAPLEQQVAAAFERLAKDGIDGDVLVFLPGAAEIRRAMRTCSAAAARAGLDVLPLHGDLSSAEQDRAVLPGPSPKLILSTNVAESSITIEGITAVIDSGLARFASDSPWTGLPSVDIGRISKASATQRAGRAGRVRPGRVIRLYTEEDYARRAEHDVPAILRRELSHVLLDLEAMGVHELEWLEAPPSEAVAAARELLRRLGGDVPAMARLPLHPRLSRMVTEAQRRGVGEWGCAAAAVLSAGERLDGVATHPAPSDVLSLVEREWQPVTRRVFDQVRRALGGRLTKGRDETALLMSILCGFPDRVARRRQGREYLLAGGGSAELGDMSGVQGEEWIVAIEVESRRDRRLPLIRVASGIRPDWLLDLYGERIEERAGVEWNRVAERVEQVNALLWEGLTVMESRGGVADEQAAAELLAARAMEEPLSRFVDADELNALLARAAFAAQRLGDAARLEEEDVRAALRDLCWGKRTFAELERADVLGALRVRVGRLEEVAPARVRLSSGRQIRVNYEPGKPPWIASRLQDFFGMQETPLIGGQRVVAHLLGPNGRAVQVTSDLAGFWQGLYPRLRKELMRRYPRHSWPENV